MNQNDLQNRSPYAGSTGRNQMYLTPSRRQDEISSAIGQGSQYRSGSRQDRKFFNTNQTIRRSEVLNASKYVCDELDADEIIKLREVFARWDQDGNGSLSPLEMKQALMQYDKNIPQTLVNVIFGLLDNQGKGAIEFEDFISAFKRKIILDSIEKTYNQYDSEKKGYITLLDLKNFTQRKLKQREEDSLLEQIITTVGTDGKITKQQFINVMVEYFKQIK